MDQPRFGGTVNRRRFLKTAAGTTAGAALTAWSLKRGAPATAAVRSDRARAAEPNPKRGGVLKWAGPAEVAHFDVHQGAFRFVLGQMYNNLVRFNPADGQHLQRPVRGSGQGRGDRSPQRAVHPQGAAAVLPRALHALVDGHLLQE